MKWTKIKEISVLRLQAGEEIIKTLKDFVMGKKIKSGYFIGLGAAKEITLGYFDIERKGYIRKFFPQEYEICSLTGNIAWSGDEVIIHCHTVISAPNFACFGGHLFQAMVTATCEIFLIPFYKKLKRSSDPFTGLSLLEI